MKYILMIISVFSFTTLGIANAQNIKTNNSCEESNKFLDTRISKLEEIKKDVKTMGLNNPLSYEEQVTTLFNYFIETQIISLETKKIDSNGCILSPEKKSTF